MRSIVHKVRSGSYHQTQDAMEKLAKMRALFDLHADVLDMYAHHEEVCTALHHWGELLKRFPRAPKNPDPKVFFGKDKPKAQDAKFQYSKNVDALIADSAKNGVHASMLRRSVITLTYSIWEDQYRQLIAYECGLSHKNDIQSDVFHDLSRYRQAILHAGGRLVDTPKAIMFFNKGDQVLLTHDHIYEIFSILVEELNRIGEVYYKQGPRLTLDVSLNANKPT